MKALRPVGAAARVAASAAVWLLAGTATSEAQTCACNDFNGYVTVGGNLCAGSGGPNGCNLYVPGEDLEIIDPTPALWFSDRNLSQLPTIWWELRASTAAWQVADLLSSRIPLTIEPGAPDETLHLDATGFVGIGTSIPAQKLHLWDPFEARIRIQTDVGASSDRTDLYAGGTGLWFQDVLNDGPAQNIVKFNHGSPPNMLVLEGPSGEVGLGTSTPVAALHLMRTDGTAQFLVQEVGPAQTRRLLDLQNNGGIRMRLLDTSTGTSWAYQNIGGLFRINAGGAGDPFVLDTAGNLTIGGTLTQNSDRHTKTSIEPVWAEDVLSRVARLPINTWALVGDTRAVRHLGPMAQDFAAAFGLGADDRHVAPVDMAGVALAAIQALDRQVRDRDVRITALEAQNAGLAARLAALETAVSTRIDTSSDH